MTREDNIIVPRWFLENVENTLRIQNNINLDKKTGETCQDRNVRESLNGLRKLLKGEELTGRERSEKLQPSLPSNLDEAAIDAAQLDMQDRQIMEATNEERLRYSRIFRRGFKARAEWMAGQGVTLEGHVCKDEYVTEPPFYYVETENSDDLPLVGDKVIVQIRKKQ